MGWKLSTRHRPKLQFFLQIIIKVAPQFQHYGVQCVCYVATGLWCSEASCKCVKHQFNKKRLHYR